MSRAGGRPDPAAAAEWVAVMFPVDGPHDPERVAAAGAAIADLGRYLAHATRTGAGLRYAGQVCGLAGSLRQACAALGQTCEQLATRLAALAGDPTLRHDRGDDPVAAARLAAGFAERAADDFSLVGESLSLLNSHTAALGHDVSGGGR